MEVINKVKAFLDDKGITPYQFVKDTGVAEGTAYGLYNNPEQLPSPNTIRKIVKAYKCKPCAFIDSVQVEAE